MNKEVLAGDTIRLKAKFKTFDNTYTDPDNICIKIYDSNKNEIAVISLDSNNRLSEGSYFYDYKIPNNYAPGLLTFAFEGKIDNKDVVSRKTIPIAWSK